ncbi:MAG: hypothetical protein IPI04_02740 [Ignavibacteria bacterium]|nr:hypothetical protein [Ignavibacteria bacterium]
MKEYSIFTAVSFIVLVITGFALKFPESFWVKGIAAIIGQNTFEDRGIVHRVASVVLDVVSAYHVFYLLFTTRAAIVKRFFFQRNRILQILYNQ